MLKHTYTVFLALLMMTSGCRVGPNYPVASAPSAPVWKHVHDTEPGPQVDNWWEVFDDEMLNCLEKQALGNNRELLMAFERIYQARSLAGIVCADLYPQVSIDPYYSYQYILQKLFAPPGTNMITSKNNLIHEPQFVYRLPLDISYEIDMWGRLKSLCESSYFHAQAIEHAFQSALLVLTAELANNYFQIRSLDTQIDLYRDTIKAYEKALQINQSRYEGQIVNYSDVSRAALELTNVQAEYYEIMRQREVLENAMAVLVGVPASEFEIAHTPLWGTPPDIPAGVPSDVMLKRPDIRAAERERASDHASIRAAYAAFFPSFEITGFLGFSSPDLRHFLSWKSRLIGGAVDIGQTVFDGGRKCADLQYTIALFREADANYQQTVLTAFQEVEDALVNIERYVQEHNYIEQSVKNAQKTYTIANDRYLRGVTFYLDVVIAEQQLLNAKRADIILQARQFTATIQLIKALGGSWNE